MRAGPVPFLWLVGASGVGKTAVGWALYRALDIPAGFLDADQIGLCYPAPPDDPDQHALKAANLAALWPAFRDSGIRCFVLSGGVARADLVARYTDRLAGAAVTVCRLHAGAAELTRRFLGRGWMTHLLDESLTESQALQRNGIGDVCVDTDGRSVAEVAAAVRAAVPGWP